MKKTLLLLIIIGFCVTTHSQADYSKHSLPVISITTDSLNLWGPTGIYSNPEMEGKEWERPCQVSFYENKILRISFSCGIRVQGESSVTMPKKSFRFFFRKEYGMGKLNFPIFGEGNLAKFDKLVIKAGYDDDLTTASGTLMRDALSTELWKMAGGIPQLSRWVVVYINNKYWGIYNLRESIDESFIQDHLGLATPNIIRFRNEGPDLVFGTIDTWQTLYDEIKTVDFSNSAEYERITSELNYDDFLRLMAFVQCSQYYSWAWGTTMFNDGSSPWRFSIWDTDRAYTSLNWDGFDELYNSTTSYKWANNFYHHLYQNSEFKKRLLVSINDLQNTVFQPNAATAVLDSIYSIIQSEIPREIARWNPTSKAFDSNFASVHSFLKNRPDVVNSQISKTFKIDTSRVQIELNVVGNGYIKANIIDVRQYPWKGTYFKGSQIKLTAIPDSGYHFTGWNTELGTNNDIASFQLTNNQSITASFAKGRVGIENTILKSIELKSYPNPFQNQVRILFRLEKASILDANIISTDGKIIRTLFSGRMESGLNHLDWNGNDKNGLKAASGVYLINIRTKENQYFTKTIVKL